MYQFSTQKVGENDEKAKNTKNNEEKAQNFGWRADFTQMAGELVRLGLFR